jgi:hypothetical protein
MLYHPDSPDNYRDRESLSADSAFIKKNFKGIAKIAITL